MPTCCVYRCESGSSAKNSFRTFQLPPKSNEELRGKWLEQINRKNFIPSENARVCILHFSEDSFIPEEENKDSSGRQRKKLKLKPWAVPTLNMQLSHRELKINPMHL